MVIKVKNKEALKELKIKLFDLRVEKDEYQKTFNEIEDEMRKEIGRLESECRELETLRNEVNNSELVPTESDVTLLNMIDKTKTVDTSTKKLHQTMRKNMEKLNRVFKAIEVLIMKENMLVEMIDMQMSAT